MTTRAPGHPGPAVARVPSAILDAVVAQARAEQPLEACGLVVGTAPLAAGGMAVRYVPCRNALSSRSRFSIDPDDLYRVTVDADDADEVIWGIAHSHPHSAGVPSTTDIGLALYPDALHLLASPEPAWSVRGWRIVDGVAHEVVLEPA